MIRSTVTCALTIVVAASGCIDGLEPGQLGAGRRLGDTFPGPVAAVLPPLTDRDGNLFVVTGVPDSTGRPAPGIAHVGPARGSWTAGCQTNDTIRGPAKGWVGTTSGVGWLWGDNAILELDTAGNCVTRLDRDPASASDITFLGVAPVIEETLSGNFAVAILTTAADPTPHLVTVDLGLGTIVAAEPLAEGTTVLGTGADPATGDAAFAIQDAAGARVIFAAPHGSISATAPISGAMGPLGGELVLGNDGSFAAVVAADAVLVGDRRGGKIIGTDFSAIGVQRDDSGWLWVVGQAGAEPRLAPAIAAGMGASQPWTTATALAAALEAGVIVFDERVGERTSATWSARSALGPVPMIEAHTSPSYAVGTRALLIENPPVDRGGIPYSQLAVIPAGVSFP